MSFLLTVCAVRLLPFASRKTLCSISRIFIQIHPSSFPRSTFPTIVGATIPGSGNQRSEPADIMIFEANLHPCQHSDDEAGFHLLRQYSDNEAGLHIHLLPYYGEMDSREDLENEICFITILRLSIPTTVGAKNSRLELVNIAAGELTLNIHLYLYEVESGEDLENCFDVTTVTERQFLSDNSFNGGRLSRHFVTTDLPFGKMTLSLQTGDMTSQQVSTLASLLAPR